MADLGYEARKKAENQRSSGNIDGAITTLEDYLLTNPRDKPARLLLSNILIYDKRNTDLGLIQLDAILETDPDYDEARKALITILKRSKKFNDETSMHFEILVNKYPDDPDLLHSFGIFCREQLLDFTRALEVFKRCVELRPNNEAYRLSYASLLINDFRMYLDGKEQLEYALELNPNNQKTIKALQRLQKRKYQANKGPRRGITRLLSK